MSSAVQPGFNTKLAHPYSLLCQVFSLDQCRPVVAYFNSHFLVERTICARIECREFFKVIEQPWIQSRRKYNGGVAERAVDIPAQRSNRKIGRASCRERV